MNFGRCPYNDCDGTLWLPVPEDTPAYALVPCPKCGKAVWYRFSRLDPEVWTKEDFEAKHEIDSENRTIKEIMG